jgi:hypothetical protein
MKRGFRPYDPDLLFVLKQKVSKKFKTPPASLKKWAFMSGSRSNLLPPYVGIFKQERLCPLSHLFFGSSDEIDPNLPPQSKINYPIFPEKQTLRLLC